LKFNTHLYLGEILHQVICEKWDIPISKKHFLYGCIKPDMTSLILRHPHFYKISHKYIMKKIIKLSKKSLSMKKKNKKFSEDLGVVLHYIADFFTSAHNRKPNKLMEHIVFEEKLCIAFENIKINTVRDYFDLMKNEFKSAEMINNKIMRLHKINQHNYDCVEYDIHEILIACVVVINGIMNLVSE